MKTKLTLIIILLITISSLAQQGINYKALIKDASENVIANQSVTISFNILQGTTQTNVYQETHTTPTDDNGIIIVNIGEGVTTLGDFDTIDWGNDDHFLNVKINTGNGLIDMGTTQFMAVPYALSAANVGLEPLDEGNGIGWRLKGRDPDFYLNIGENAVDLSVGVFSAIPIGASGEGSIAMGSRTKALGDYSTTMGFESEASGRFSTAIGNNTIASEENSTAMGNLSTASGLNSTAMGINTTASEENSTAMGNFSRASGVNSTAMGYNTEALDDNSTAMGSGTEASGISSTAMGSGTEASGDFSTAMGNGTTAFGNSSIAMGNETTASGDYSTAMGRFARADAIYSTALGSSTNADAYSSLAIGRFNVGGGNGSFYDVTNPLFEVGNGTDDANRSNTLTVFGGSDATLADPVSGYLMIGNANSFNLVMDRDEIMARSNGATSSLSLQPDGGAVIVGGVLAHASDRRLKKDIQPLSYGLKEIVQLQPKVYNWKNRKQEYKSLGLIAQEVQPIIKELITTQNNQEKTLGISYTELIPVLINAIKEQQTMINTLQSKLEHNNSAFNDLSARIKEIEKLLFQKKHIEVANNNK